MYLLGIDAGASKTHCLVADEKGKILGFGTGGTGNYEVFGLEHAMKEIDKAISEALNMAGIEKASLGCFCLAGADFPEDFEMLEDAVSKLERVDRVIIKNDTMAALKAGIIEEPYGIAVIMGTGTNAVGIGKSGEEARLFGEGYIFGDWGGSGDISREILHRVFRAYDGRGEDTILSKKVLEFFQESDFVSLAKKLYYGKIDRSKMLLLTPILFECAYQGDKVSVEIVKMIARETALSAYAIMKSLSLVKEKVKVVLGGSIFKAKGPLLTDFIRAELHSFNPIAEIVLPKYEPVVGALLLSFDYYFGQVVKEIYDNVESTVFENLKINREEWL
ncbi:MAG: kinase [bacterium]|nr:kinase [bacterium]